MNPETIALIIKWGPWALIGLVFLWFFIIGVIRGTYKVTRRLLYVVVYIALIWLFIGNITDFLLNFNFPIKDGIVLKTYIVDFVDGCNLL